MCHRPPAPKDTTVDTCTYGQKRVFVFDDHSVALKPWAQMRAELGTPPILLTLDHHTDTDAAFFRKAYDVADFGGGNIYDLMNQYADDLAFTEPSSIETAIQRLENDEHIAAAVDAGIIEAAMVISIAGAAPTTPEEYFATKICRLETQRELGSFPERVLGSRFLGKTLEEIEWKMFQIGKRPLTEEPFILDIDLDYFETLSAARPKQRRVFYTLIRKAYGITVAREPRFVLNCRTDLDVTAASLWEILDAHFEEAWNS